MECSTKVLPFGNCIVVCIGCIITVFHRMAMVPKSTQANRSSIHGTVVLVQRPPQCLSNGSIIPEPEGLASQSKVLHPSGQVLSIHESIPSETRSQTNLFCRKWLPFALVSPIILPCKTKRHPKPLRMQHWLACLRSSVHQS